MRILFIGDVVAATGRRMIREVLPMYIRNNNIDFCIVNLENSAHGLGVSSKIISEAVASGADAVTLGNHTFSNYEFVSQITKEKIVVRPANVSDSWPGKDYIIFEKNSQKVAVFNLLGQVGSSIPCDNPFSKADSIIDEIKKKGCNTIILDFHAEATSEKQALGYYLDGRVSAVIGTHTHVQTADNRILPEETGYMTDCGMTGPVESVIGMDVETSLRRFVSKVPARYEPADGDGFMCGVLLEINKNGKCEKIVRVCEYE